MPRLGNSSSPRAPCSATHKFPAGDVRAADRGLGSSATTLIVGACVRARAMRRDDAPEFKALVSRLFESLDAETPSDGERAPPSRSAWRSDSTPTLATSDSVSGRARTRMKSSSRVSASSRQSRRDSPRTRTAPSAFGDCPARTPAVKLAGGVPASVALSPQFKLFALFTGRLARAHPRDVGSGRRCAPRDGTPRRFASRRPHASRPERRGRRRASRPVPRGRPRLDRRRLTRRRVHGVSRERARGARRPPPRSPSPPCIPVASARSTPRSRRATIRSVEFVAPPPPHVTYG